MKTRVMLCAAAAIAGLMPQLATADTGNPVADRCIVAIREDVSRCQNAVADELHECLPRIRRLVAAGNQERATAVARGCAEKVKGITERCDNHLTRVCRYCVDELLDMGEIELAREIQQLCVSALDRMESLENRAVNAIQGALAG